MALQNKLWAAGLAFFLGVSWAWSGNNDLTKTEAVPAGERVANYLQACLTTFGTILESEKSGDLLGGAQTYRVVVVYDPGQKVLDITLIGNKQDPKAAQTMLEAVRDVILKLDPRIRKNFGVTLGEGDLSMDYIYAKSGRILLKYRDGGFMPGPGQDPLPVSTPTPIPGLNP